MDKKKMMRDIIKKISKNGENRDNTVANPDPVSTNTNTHRAQSSAEN